LSKATNIYWDDATWSTTRKPTISRKPQKKAVAAPKRKARSAPLWASFVIVAGIFTMLCVSINYRAFTEVKEEVEQNGRLSSQIQNLMDENLALQEEIHTLKSDPRVIETQARKIGIDLRQEKVPVPAN
jgi:cell division protein FtsL